MKRFGLFEIFTDNMVVQQKAPIHIFGYGPNRSKITATMGDNSASTFVVNDEWQLFLPEVSAGGPYTVVIDCNTEEKIIINNIMCGEVWIAGGQSNMEFALCSGEVSEEVKNNPDVDNVWIYNVPRRTFENTDTMNEKLESCITPNSNWIECKGQTALNFSAVAYYFAKELINVINVPIGIINCNWGNTSIVNWLPEELLRTIPKFNKILDDYIQIERDLDIEEYNKQYIKYLNDLDDFVALMNKLGDAPKDIPCPMPPLGPKSYLRPSGLYNTMLSKIIRYRTQGILWYQGESDAILNNCDVYKDALLIFYNYLKLRSGNPEMYFLNVQLAPFGGGWVPGDLWPNICQIQLEVTAKEDNYAMITIGDCGDVNIHPPKKREVGERLALAACNKCYKLDVEYCGPLPEIAWLNTNSVYIKFSHTADGLKTLNNDAGKFEVAGKDAVFYNAEAQILKDSVILFSDNVEKPLYARYAWDVYPYIGLYNSVNLPASLFSIKLVNGNYSLH